MGHSGLCHRRSWARRVRGWVRVRVCPAGRICGRQQQRRRWRRQREAVQLAAVAVGRMRRHVRRRCSRRALGAMRPQRCTGGTARVPTNASCNSVGANGASGSRDTRTQLCQRNVHVAMRRAVRRTRRSRARRSRVAAAGRAARPGRHVHVLRSVAAAGATVRTASATSVRRSATIAIAVQRRVRRSRRVAPNVPTPRRRTRRLPLHDDGLHDARDAGRPAGCCAARSARVSGSRGGALVVAGRRPLRDAPAWGGWCGAPRAAGCRRATRRAPGLAGAARARRCARVGSDGRVGSACVHMGRLGRPHSGRR